MTDRCFHSQHGFKVYGRSAYTEATCPKCLLSAYTSSTHGNSRRDKITPHYQKPIRPLTKSKCPTPFTDTVSHFPSPGGEAECNVYQPHLPLINSESEIRPSDVPRFSKKLSNPTEEILNHCKSPWEKENVENTQGILMIEENDEKPAFLCSSSTEEKLRDINYARNLLKDKKQLEQLATKQFYKTTTQKFYEGVDWSNMLRNSARPSPLPPSKYNKNELEGQIRRYHGKQEDYQRLTEASKWDSVQTRNGHFINRPVSFVSESKNIDQIPNYGGTTGGFGEKDVRNESFTPLTVLRTPQPKYVATGRKPYIPGYTGCVLSGQYTEVFTNEPLPRAETTARAHSRYNTYPMNYSKHNHHSALSNSVTLTDPFNPFNRSAPSINRTWTRSNHVY